MGSQGLMTGDTQASTRSWLAVDDDPLHMPWLRWSFCSHVVSFSGAGGGWPQDHSAMGGLTPGLSVHAQDNTILFGFVLRASCSTALADVVCTLLACNLWPSSCLCLQRAWKTAVPPWQGQRLAEPVMLCELYGPQPPQKQQGGAAHAGKPRRVQPSEVVPRPGP